MIKAASNGHKEIVSELLKVKGIDVNLKDKDGYTALIKAASNGHKEIVNDINNKLSNDTKHIDEINEIIFTTQFSEIIGIHIEEIKNNFKLIPGNDNSKIIEILLTKTLIGYRNHNITSTNGSNEEINSSNLKALYNLKTLLTHCNKIADLDGLFSKEYRNSLREGNDDLTNILLSVNPNALGDKIARDPMSLIDFMNFVQCNQKKSELHEQYDLSPPSKTLFGYIKQIFKANSK